MVFLDSFINFKDDILISPPLFVSFMHLSITLLLSLSCQGSKELVKVKIPCDKGKVGRLAKESLETKDTCRLMCCTQELFL